MPVCHPKNFMPRTPIVTPIASTLPSILCSCRPTTVLLLISTSTISHYVISIELDALIPLLGSPGKVGEETLCVNAPGPQQRETPHLHPKPYKTLGYWIISLINPTFFPYIVNVRLNHLTPEIQHC
jgi:hypothetical protein